MKRAEIESQIQQILKPYGITEVRSESGGMGAWYVEFQSDEFTVTVSQDRTGDSVGICVGSRIRRQPRARMRGPWSVSHLRGYLDGQRDYFTFNKVEDQIDWLHENLSQLLDTSLLNSDELKQWAVKAAKQMFG